jgi:hypothetical protein
MDLCVSTSALQKQTGGTADAASLLPFRQRVKRAAEPGLPMPACLPACLGAFYVASCVPASPSQGTATKQILFPCWALVSLGDRTLYGGINSDSDSIGNVRVTPFQTVNC